MTQVTKSPFKFRTGDEININVRIWAPQKNIPPIYCVRVVDGEWESPYETFFSEEDLSHGVHVARPFYPGDDVRRRGGSEFDRSRKGSILAIYKDAAWVAWNDPENPTLVSFSTTQLDDLERA